MLTLCTVLVIVAAAVVVALFVYGCCIASESGDVNDD